MIEFTLIHDGKDWIAENPQIRVAASTLEELDRCIKASLIREGAIQPGEVKKVFMAFDNATIPQWIRQYAPHYFNRVLKVTLALPDGTITET